MDVDTKSLENCFVHYVKGRKTEKTEHQGGSKYFDCSGFALFGLTISSDQLNR